MILLDSMVFNVPVGDTLQIMGQPFLIDLNEWEAGYVLTAEALPDNGSASAFIDFQVSSDNGLTWATACLSFELVSGEVEVVPHGMNIINVSVFSSDVLPEGHRGLLLYRFMGRCVQPRKVRLELIVSPNNVNTPFGLLVPAGK